MIQRNLLSYEQLLDQSKKSDNWQTKVFLQNRIWWEVKKNYSLILINNTLKTNSQANYLTRIHTKILPNWSFRKFWIWMRRNVKKSFRIYDQWQALNQIIGEHHLMNLKNQPYQLIERRERIILRSGSSLNKNQKSSLR